MQIGTIYKIVGFKGETLYGKIVDSWGGIFFDICPCYSNGDVILDGKRAGSVKRSEIEELIKQNFWSLYEPTTQPQPLACLPANVS